MVHTAFSQAQETIPHSHSYPVCSRCVTILQHGSGADQLLVLLALRSKSTMEDALQRLADRLAGVENALMQERTAKLSAEADLQSLRAHVTPTSVPPTVDHNALADSVARTVVAAQSASRTEPLDSSAFSKLDTFWSERTGWHDWAAVPQSYTSNAHADMHTAMTAVEGMTVVTPNVAVINPDSVARNKSSHFMLTMLVEGPALDIILNSGQGQGYESWWRLVLECDPRSRVRVAVSMINIVSHPCTSDSSSFEAFDAKVSDDEDDDDDDVKAGCVWKNMTDESLRDH